METTRQCFICGREIILGEKSGQITISGFYDHDHIPYYNQFNLCDICHIKLNGAIKHCLFQEEKNHA